MTERRETEQEMMRRETAGRKTYGIRAWRVEDAADLVKASNNPRVLANLRDGIPYPYREKDAREFISTMLSADPEETFAWAITADDRAVGSISIFRCGNIHYRTAEMGYYLAEPYWGRGIVTFAVKEACQRIFSETDILRIFAEPFAYNRASCRVLEKAGFICEGTLQSNAFRDGKVLDMKMYARVKGD